MKCPNCNADLSIEDGIETFYCQYCGTRIVLGGQSKEALRAKTKVKAMDLIGNMQNAYHDHRIEVRKQKAKERKEDLKHTAIGFALMIIGFAFIVSLLFIPIVSANHKINKTYNEVQQLIEEGNYEAAKAKASRLRYPEDVSKEEAKRWDEIREELLEIIDSHN